LSSIRAAIKTGRDFSVNTRLAVIVCRSSQLESSIAALAPRALIRLAGGEGMFESLAAADWGFFISCIVSLMSELGQERPNCEGGAMSAIPQSDQIAASH
jgi:hypothetical protein